MNTKAKRKNTTLQCPYGAYWLTHKTYGSVTSKSEEEKTCFGNCETGISKFSQLFPCSSKIFLNLRPSCTTFLINKAYIREPLRSLSLCIAPASSSHDSYSHLVLRKTYCCTYPNTLYDVFSLLSHECKVLLSV